LSHASPLKRGKELVLGRRFIADGEDARLGQTGPTSGKDGMTTSNERPSSSTIW
jgi:hypothetical protein